MTAASPAGTPLILIVLALCISFLSAVGSIAAVLMSRANLQRQIRVVSREAWMREFREKVSILSAAKQALEESHYYNAEFSRGDRRSAEIFDVMNPSYHAIRLLMAERGTDNAAFILVTDQFVYSTVDFEEHARKFAGAVEDILRSERAAIEAPGRWYPWPRQRLGAGKQWRPWSQLRVWLRRDPPRFPD
jgi:hypothetical protein